MEEKIFITILLYSFIYVYSNSEPKDEEQIIMNIYYNNKNYSLIESNKKDENAIAYAIYNRSYEIKGWDFLSISTYDKKDGKYNDENKAYAMGYLEGFITKDRIYSYFTNMKHYLFYKNNLTIPENLLKFYKINIDYMQKKSLENFEFDKYWEYVYYIYHQLKGLYDGYMNSAEIEKKFDFYEFIIFVSVADSMDAIYYTAPENLPNFYEMKTEDIKRFILVNSHCSALIKLADDFSDIWFGHNTWHTYTSMIRIFKEYRFVSNKGNEKSKTIVFSSYPGTLASLDDFYFLDSKLLVMETTNSIYNSTLYKLIKPEALLTWVRVMVSNRLASSAEEWTNIFKKENSGTYNDQFMILDINKIDLNNKIIPDKSLMIVEQIPGEIEINDVSNKLKEGYWPSYNVPYSKKFYEKSGYEIMLEKFPSYFSNIDYEECSRAKIFKRDQNKVKSNNDFKKLLRYNDYKNDNLSYGDPTLTLSCRGDLVEENSLCFGATDVKFVSIRELLEGKYFTHIISSPTNEQQPTFSWNTTICNKITPDRYYKEGLVDTWNFDWIDYKIQLLEINNENEEEHNDDNSDEKNDHKNGDKKDKKNDDDDDKKIFIISLSIGLTIIVIIILVIIIVIFRSKFKYDQLNEKINNISFVDVDKDIREKMV